MSISKVTTKPRKKTKRSGGNNRTPYFCVSVFITFNFITVKQIILHIPRRFRRHKVIHTTHPENWEELTPSQFIALVRVMNADISENDILMEMLNLPHNVIKKLDTYQRYTLGQLLDFIQNKAPFNRFVMPEIQGLKAPEDGLSDVSFGEFMFIDTFYANYQEYGSENDLLNLGACIYVQHTKKGERPDFNGKIDTHRIKQIHPLKLEAIALNYGLIRTWLEEAYTEVFPTASSATGSTSSGKRQSNGWIDVYDSIVGDDLINREEYLNLPCMEVLRYMNKKVKENRKKKK